MTTSVCEKWETEPKKNPLKCYNTLGENLLRRESRESNRKKRENSNAKKTERASTDVAD